MSVNDDRALYDIPVSPGLEPFNPKFKPDPEPLPFVRRQPPEAVHPTAQEREDRKKASRRRTRPSQGDSVLLQHMGPDLPDVARRAAYIPLNSASHSEVSDSEMDEAVSVKRRGFVPAASALLDRKNQDPDVQNLRISRTATHAEFREPDSRLHDIDSSKPRLPALQDPESPRGTQRLPGFGQIKQIADDSLAGRHTYVGGPTPPFSGHPNQYPRDETEWKYPYPPTPGHYDYRRPDVSPYPSHSEPTPDSIDGRASITPRSATAPRVSIDVNSRILPPPKVSGIGIVGPSYECDFPGCNALPFQTQYLLNSHANVHSQARPHYCPVRGCPRGEGGRGFKRKNEMIRHGLVHDSPGYVCPFCPDREHKYPRPDNLLRHCRVHHGDRDKDDPLLREVLNQRSDGGNKGRRRRTGQAAAS